MSRQGREFELLIEKLEKSVIPNDAKIKSPGTVYDRITNQPREVDILIEYTIGTIPIKIVIECRDRNSIQDTQWIEQVQTKVSDLKVNKVVVVSSSSFTQPARDKAKFYGIETRTYTQIDRNVISSWCKMEHVEMITKQFGIVSAIIDSEDNRLIQDILKNKNVRDKFIHRVCDDQVFCINDLFSEVANSIHAWNDLVPDGPTIRKQINANTRNKKDSFFIKQGTIRYYIKRILFIAEMNVVTKKVPISEIRSYENEEKTISQVIEFDGIDIGNNQVLQMIKNSNGSISLSARKKENLN